MLAHIATDRLVYIDLASASDNMSSPFSGEKDGVSYVASHGKNGRVGVAIGGNLTI